MGINKNNYFQICFFFSILCQHGDKDGFLAIPWLFMWNVHRHIFQMSCKATQNGKIAFQSEQAALILPVALFIKKLNLWSFFSLLECCFYKIIDVNKIAVRAIKQLFCKKTCNVPLIIFAKVKRKKLPCFFNVQLAALL